MKITVTKITLEKDILNNEEWYYYDLQVRPENGTPEDIVPVVNMEGTISSLMSKCDNYIYSIDFNGNKLKIQDLRVNDVLEVDRNPIDPQFRWQRCFVDPKEIGR